MLQLLYSVEIVKHLIDEVKNFQPILIRAFR